MKVELSSLNVGLLALLIDILYYGSPHGKWNMESENDLFNTNRELTKDMHVKEKHETSWM